MRVLRIGLPDSKELKENYIAGAYHPSLGEMVISRDIRNRIEENVKNNDVKILVNPRFLSKLNGNKRCNIEYFTKKGIKITVEKDSAVEDFIIL